MSGKREYPDKVEAMRPAPPDALKATVSVLSGRRIIAAYTLCRHAGIATLRPEEVARIEAEIREVLDGKRVLVDLPPGFSLQPIERDV